MESFKVNGGFKDDYIFLLTDDTGMLQHSKCSLPDPRHGYTTDDNARALIMALMLYEKFKKKEYLDLIYRYASFLVNAQNEKGKFRNFMEYDRKWLEKEGSEDCFGRCIWALCFALSRESTPRGVKDGLSYIFKNAKPHIENLTALRARAYAIIGLSHLKGNEEKSLIIKLARSLCREYEDHKDGDWKWFEDNVTYCNSIFPWSLILAYEVTKEKEFLTVAEENLKFLEGVTFKDGYFKPVGCHGWLLKGGKPAEYDEQTVEACEAVLTYLEAYKVTGNKDYLQKAKICHSWYEGTNSKGISLIDSENGGCYDGLTAEKGVNLNMGAESQVSYVISYLKISDVNTN